MWLIQDSKDLLYVVIAFCILWLTIFLAWFIYYLAMMMRQFNQIVKEMRERLKKVDEAIDALKQKIEHSVSYLSLIGDGMKKLVEVAKEHGVSIGKKSKKKSSKK
jgi:predicted PurR-regulated permease PerM